LESIVAAASNDRSSGFELEQQMTGRRMTFSVRLRRQVTGEEHLRMIFAPDETTAKERAIVKARVVLPVMAERQYERFDVVSCDVDTSAAVSRKPTSS
jgi:hypothetical protein